ncbi:hypothetical protein [Amycolatopsis japonica]|nr:hypothetical protein [Amycolatopsis japonica]
MGSGAIDLTPVELTDFAVRTFGTYSKWQHPAGPRAETPVRA